MADFDLVVKNGTVVTAADTQHCDIGIKDGTVVALGRGLGPAAREIDARGKIVMPGAIDSHCHIEQRSGFGVVCADDFHSATVAAAFGGTTTVIPFAAQHRGESLRQVVDAYRDAATPKAVIDYAFHLIVTDPNEQVLGQELPALIQDGFTSFKVYMTYDAMRLDDRQMLEILALARREGALVMVHAENHDIIRWLGGKLIEAGHTAPKFHAIAHDRLAERDASQRAITLAEIVGVPLLIVHVSGSEAADQIRWAQGQGLRIYGETCTQYLVLSDDGLDKEEWDGAMHVCTPPPRDKANQEAIWRGLATGVFQVVSSDHAPFRYDDPQGKLLNGKGAPFNKIPPGIPGLEVRLPILFSEGVGGGRIDLNQFVALSATNHAKIYGLYPRKGTIAVGSDADIAIWDPDKDVTISVDMLHDNMDYTPYQGMRVRGWPVVTISRGEVVVEDGKLVAEPGRGAFLRCE